MAIEQSKAPAPSAHVHGAPKTAGKAAPSAEGAAHKSGQDFAAFLASSEELIGMETQVSGNDSGNSPVSLLPAKSVGGSHKTPVDRSGVRTAKDDASKEAKEDSAASSVLQGDDPACAVLANGPAPMPAAQLSSIGSGIFTGSIEAFNGGQPAESETSAAPVRWSGAANHGLVSTQQLQQSLAYGGKPGKTGALGLDKGVRQGEVGSVDSSAPNLASNADSARDMPIKTLVARVAEAVNPPAVMDLVSSIIARHSSQGAARDGDGPAILSGATNTDDATGPIPELVDMGGSSLSADDVVSEPVRFWFGADQTQQADMTVDDVGGGAVDVSIRLQGKEAHVVFRTDELAARDALQSGTGELKDLLGQGGLSLSGMSVATSTSDGYSTRKDARDGKMPGGQPKVSRVTLEPAVVGPGSAARPSVVGASGRGVDLYV